MAIKLVNIDDRLVHGQVATSWVKSFGIESIIVVDDKAANDPVQKKIAGLAVPGVQVNIFSVDKFLDVMKKTTIKKDTMLLFGTPISLIKVMKAGHKYDYVNVSGMRYNSERHRLQKNVSVTKEELDAFKAIINMGVEVYAQTTTRDEKTDLKSLIEKYKE